MKKTAFTIFITFALLAIAHGQTTTTYKGMSVRTPDPTGEAGLAWQSNFKELADRVGPCKFDSPTTQWSDWHGTFSKT